MTIWKEFEGWTYEYFDRDIEPAALPGFEDLVRLWQGKRGDRAVPSWSDFDFYDFKGWHGRLSVYDVSYDPYAYTCRLSGTEVTGLELEKKKVEPPAAMEFYEMNCRQMRISRLSGSLKIAGREHAQITFIEFPLSDDGLRATQTLEAMIVREAA